jgi:hypothetical protein
MIYQGVILVVARLRNKWKTIFIELQSGEVVFSLSIIFGGLDMQGLRVLFVVEHGHVESWLVDDVAGEGEKDTERPPILKHWIPWLLTPCQERPRSVEGVSDPP